MLRVAVAVHEGDGDGADSRHRRRSAKPHARPSSKSSGVSTSPLGTSPARHLDDVARRASPAARCGGRRAGGGSGSRCAAASPKPSVVTKSVRSPLRSSSALVATVVPIFTASTARPGGRCRHPWPRPSSIADALDGGVLVAVPGSRTAACASTSAPSGALRATTSVKVPPRSIQNCQAACLLSPSIGIPIRLAHRSENAAQAQPYKDTLSINCQRYLKTAPLNYKTA